LIIGGGTLKYFGFRAYIVTRVKPFRGEKTWGVEEWEGLLNLGGIYGDFPLPIFALWLKGYWINLWV